MRLRVVTVVRPFSTCPAPFRSAFDLLHCDITNIPYSSIQCFFFILQSNTPAAVLYIKERVTVFPVELAAAV